MIAAIAQFWAQYGALAYLGAAVWAFFEGETFVLVSAVLGRSTHALNPWLLMVSVWIGSFLGDQLWFTLGRVFGAAAARRIPGGERRLTQATQFLDRYGIAFVLLFRFAYGVRNVAAIAIGAAGMRRRRFAMLNFVAAGVWAGGFVWSGWYLAGWIGARNTGIAIGVAGLIVVIGLLWRYRRSRAVGKVATP